MQQLSRPFQILLVVFVLFAAVWFVALRKHSSSSENTSAPAPSSSAQHAASTSSPGGGTPASSGSTYNGSAPGVAGLSRAIQKARGAVAQSQQNANQLQQKSAQASGQTQNDQTQNSKQTQHSSQAQSGQAQKSQTQGGTQQHQNSTQTHSASAKSAPSAFAQAHSKAVNGIPAMQATVESELQHGKVVALLFFNPKGSVDAAVRRELRRAGDSSHGKLAVHLASAKQVGTFGSFTRTVQVYSTPTILLINKAGVTSSLTGLTDAFSIEQAIREVKTAK